MVKVAMTRHPMVGYSHKGGTSLLITHVILSLLCLNVQSIHHNLVLHAKGFAAE